MEAGIEKGTARIVSNPLFTFAFGVLTALTATALLPSTAPNSAENRSIAKLAQAPIVRVTAGSPPTATISQTPAENDSGETVSATEYQQILRDIRTASEEHLKFRRGLLRATMRNRELESEMAALRGGDSKSQEELDAIAEREELLRQQPVSFDFTRASLRDSLRFLADDAGIDFLMPEMPLPENTLITFKVEASPFQILETVAHTHGYALAKEGPVWTLDWAGTDPSGANSALNAIEAFEESTGMPATNEEFEALSGGSYLSPAFNRLLAKLNP